jgi:hypothetical protein
MLGCTHHGCAARLLAALTLCSVLLVPAPSRVIAAPRASVQHEALLVDGSGWVRLHPHAPRAPENLGGQRRFGLLMSPALSFETPFRALRLNYAAEIPPGATALLDVRTSTDGTRWTAWHTDLASGAEVEFEAPARLAQYRVTLLADGQSPAVGQVVLTPAARPPRFSAMQERPIAPTFTVRATRQGMVGGRTANGHVIQKRDRFVSLPCRCVLSSKGGGEYMVRLAYQGRSAVVPVYDVGPWNIRDNYWDPQDQRHFGDLRQGWPQDHAAFFDGHNNGRAHKGRVRFPTAVDVGDGVWWDDLQIKGDQATVEITLLWMGRDPLEASPAPTPVPSLPPAPTQPPAPTPAPTAELPPLTEPPPPEPLPSAEPSEPAP